MAGKKIDRGVRKLGRGRYEFRAMRDGLTISRVVRAASDAEAKRMRRAWEVEIDSGRVQPAGDSLNALLDRWLLQKQGLGRSPTTLALYQGVADRHIRPFIGDLPMNRVTTLQLDTLYADLRSAGVGVVTIKKVHLVLSGAFNQALRWGLVASNPASNATPPPAPKPKTAERTPTVEQVRALIDAAAATGDRSLAAFVHLAAATGARRGELLALRWSDVSFESCSILIARGAIRVPGGVAMKAPKSGRSRRVAIDPNTLELLAELRARNESDAADLGGLLSADGYLFSSRPGGTHPWRPETATRRVRELAETLGLHGVTLHGLRHFHCSTLIAAGEDPVTVSARVGHARPSITTDIYSHAQPERDRQASEKIGNWLSAASEIE